MTDGRRIPPTPSAFQDLAWRRDAGHDAMQSEFLKFLRGRPTIGIPAGALVHRDVEGEYAIVRNGQVISFADAIETLVVNLTTIVSLFEIKPKIHTVFGVVRQAKSMLELAKSAIPADQHYCHVVVPSTDPLISILRAEWPHVWAWGVEFERVAEEV